MTGLPHEFERLRSEWGSLPFPAELDSGAEYARKMHQHSLDFYVRRLRQIGFRGNRVLDAGCGTGTWSFAMGVDSGEVHGVDRNPPRISTAEWIKERFGVQNVQFDEQDITRLDFPEDTFDAVFCYGVVISYLDLSEVLRELRRVMRKGGLLYVCLNGIGWSMYLRDERGADSPEHAAMGKQGIYNTVCRQHLQDVRHRLLQLAPKDLSTDLADPSTVSGARKLLADLAASLFTDGPNPLLTAADVLQNECGEEYVHLLASDLLALAGGSTRDFSHARAGRGYAPAEAELACRKAGLSDFTWGAEGSLTFDGDPPAGALFGGWYNGNIQVWEFVARASDVPRPSPVPIVTGSSPGWSLGDDRWGRRQKPGTFGLRPYPYPYRAALAVSNDTDGMSLASLDSLHEFVNGTGSTKYGDGLGLEMGDSFWIWSPEGQLSLFHNMPHERDLHRAPEASRIAELGRSGVIDTLHGFGAWREDWTIDRDTARWGLEQLTSLGITPSIYVNHGGRGPLDGGGGFNMKHNMGGPWAYYQEGDKPDSPSYCLDLLREAGFSYFWTDVLFETNKFGDYQRFRNQHYLNRAISEYNFSRFVNRRSSEQDTSLLPAFPEAKEEELNALLRVLFNRTLFPLHARDGSPAYFFKRYRGEWAPNSGNFALQVSSDRLDALEESRGAVIVYQHFGIWRALGTDKGHPSARRTGADVLDPHGVEAFRELARRQESGRLLVATVRRLLDYLRVRDNLVFTVTKADNGTRVVRLKGIDCPVEGKTPLSPGLLEGIALTIPQTWPETVIEVDGMKSVPPYKRAQDPEGHEDVLYFPWSRLDYPLPGKRSRRIPAGPFRRLSRGNRPSGHDRASKGAND